MTLQRFPGAGNKMLPYRGANTVVRNSKFTDYNGLQQQDEENILLYTNTIVV
jgi:hypothetical protein